MYDDKAIIEFLRRSYFAVDGLWFVRVEQEHSYDEALRLDEQVWEILPKIQARKACELLHIQGSALADLALALNLKFIAEGYDYRVMEQVHDTLRIGISACPWLAILQKSGRMSKAVEVCDRVCTRDFSGWAAEFSEGIAFSLPKKLPDGASVCELVFTYSRELVPDSRVEKEAAG